MLWWFVMICDDLWCLNRVNRISQWFNANDSMLILRGLSASKTLSYEFLVWQSDIEGVTKWKTSQRHLQKRIPESNKSHNFSDIFWWNATICGRIFLSSLWFQGIFRVFRFFRPPGISEVVFVSEGSRLEFESRFSKVGTFGIDDHGFHSILAVGHVYVTWWNRGKGGKVWFWGSKVFILRKPLRLIGVMLKIRRI